MEQCLQLLQGAPKVEIYDLVVVNLEENIVKMMQAGHGGWGQGMRKYLGKKGRVRRIDSDEDVEVKFKHAKLIFNPNVVAKVLSVGDTVEITKDLEKAKYLQQNHGSWVSEMSRILGKTGEVLHVFDSYDVCVRIDDRPWCLNPLLCTVTLSNLSDSDSDSDDELLEPSDKPVRTMAELLFRISTTAKPTLKLSKSAIKWTELHLSVLMENENETKILLEKNTDTNEIDRLGNSALHMAVIKNNPNIIKLLLQNGARADILNEDNHAPIHMAVMSGHRQCLRELLDSSINIEDEDGDVPLGLAIMKKDSDAIDLLLSHPRIDLMKTNNKGFSAFHLAAKAGDAGTLRMILQKKPDIVNVKKRDGYSALHLAAVNNHLSVAKILVQEGKAELNVRDCKDATPLILAAEMNNFDLVRLLVSEGSDIDSQDRHGDTALHVAIKQKTQPRSLLKMLVSKRSPENPVNVLTYLVEKGASLSIQNKQRKTPLDMIDDDSLKANLQKRADQRQMMRQNERCLICSVINLLVKFEPCGHMKLCVECNSRNIQIKKCMTCGREINEKILPKMKRTKIDYDLKSLFKIGEMVRISMNEDLFNETEAKDNPDKRGLLGKVGIVERIDDKILVIFEGKKYSFAPEILTKVFQCGDQVELLKDVDLVRSLHEDIGWVEGMEEITGQVGTVKQIEEKYIAVEINNKIWNINLMACVDLKKPIQEMRRSDVDANCCVKCNQITTEFLTLQCGHKYCDRCKVLEKCFKCIKC